VDYHTLLGDIKSQYREENHSDVKYLSQEVALRYFYLVIKALIADLSDYLSYDSSYFEELNEN
ncbi:24717_t:CDS:1, partial [Gigaspora margarita]